MNILENEDVLRRLFDHYIKTRIARTNLSHKNTFYGLVNGVDVENYMFNNNDLVVSDDVQSQLDASVTKFFLQWFGFPRFCCDNEVVVKYIDKFGDFDVNMAPLLFDRVVEYISQNASPNDAENYIEYMKNCMKSEDKDWIYYNSEKITKGSKQKDTAHRLYVNLDADDSRILAKHFIEGCSEMGITYNFKLAKTKRDDIVVIYARDQEDIITYLKIINEFKVSNPNIEFNDPPLLTMELVDGIGYGQEPVDSTQSYTGIRTDLIFEAFTGAINHTLFTAAFGRNNDRYKDMTIESIANNMFDMPAFKPKLQECFVVSEYDIDVDNFACNGSGNSLNFDEIKSSMLSGTGKQ